MKFLILATLVAMATATPGLVQPGPAGPVPAPNPEDAFVPIAIGPAIIDSFEPVAIGPACVEDIEPVSIGPAIVDKPVPAVPVAASPLVQIILNVNAAAGVVDEEPGSKPVRPDPSPSEPIQVVEEAPVPAEPVQIGIPIIPQPINIPAELN